METGSHRTDTTFRKLTDKLDWDDVLVVTKLDRLGRNAMDVRATVERLADMQVNVHCLALGGVDLTSAAGEMTMAVIAAVAEFERDLLVEQFRAAIPRAQAVDGAAVVASQGVMQQEVILVAAERRLIDRADELSMPIGSSKFRQTSGAIVCALTEIDVIITDRGIDDASRAMVLAEGIRLRVVDRRL